MSDQVVTIEDGVATIVFSGEESRLAGVAALLAAADDPKTVQKVTLPEVAYVVAEDVARSAGLVDGTPAPPPAAVTAATGPAAPVTAPAPAPPAPNYDDGKPDLDWSRSALDAYAAKLGLDPKQYRNKDAVLEAVRAAEG